MDELKKLELLKYAKAHIKKVSEDITNYISSTNVSIQNLRERLRKGETDDPETLVALLIQQLEAKQQLEYLLNTPYFVRLDVKFDDAKNKDTLYFARFPFTKDSIYSWVAPAAAIRFEKPGRFSYILPSGRKRGGELLRKDQFMIVDKHIIFMSSESVNYLRNLIYQEYFSKQRQTFALPEIVEQMEKAQDKIIRSNYYGSFLISGAAGSGKTTLALHRVAYLVQSPQT